MELLDKLLSLIPFFPNLKREINVELLSKILSSRKEKNNENEDMIKFIDREIFDTFSSLNFIKFEHNDLKRLDNLKKDINNFNMFKGEMDNKKFWIKYDAGYLKSKELKFKTLEVLYTYSGNLSVVDKNDNIIDISEEELGDLYYFEKKYKDILNGLIKYLIYPHNNIEYSNVDFVVSINEPQHIVIDGKLEEDLKIENLRVNRKNKFIEEFNSIIDKYKTKIEMEEKKNNEIGVMTKKFNFKLIKESIDEKYEDLSERLNKLKISYKGKKFANYLENIEELKRKFEKILDEKIEG